MGEESGCASTYTLALKGSGGESMAARMMATACKGCSDNGESRSSAGDG
jgi:hypothetical protein